MAGDATPELAERQQQALRKVLMRQKLRLWASKAQQERAALAEEVMQLFSSPSAISAAANGAAIAERPITRRPGVEEVKNCLVGAVYPCLPPQCASLRAEIWQVLLNVYKRNQHGAAAQEFDRMIARLSKLPRDSMLVDECAEVAAMLAPQPGEERERVQQDMEVLLVWFLTTKSVAYTSGMARVVAPFFLQHMALPTIYDCFYQYSASFLPHFVVNDSLFGESPSAAAPASNDSSSFSESRLSIDSLTSLTGILPRSNSMDSTSSAAEEARRRVEEEEEKRKSREKQHLVEQLLSYHDPKLAHFLAQWCGNEWSTPGELIASDFFLGHLYQVMPPAVFVHVMDQYLLTGDSLFGAFVLVATLVEGGDVLMGEGTTTSGEVKDKIRDLFSEAAFKDDERVQYLCFLAARLRSKTPKSYKCSQHEASPELRCSSRIAMDMAFDPTPQIRKKTAKPKSNQSNSNPSLVDRLSTGSDIVDMSQWVKKESRSLAGKMFWYHKSTGKAQWEHPAKKHDPPAAVFALPISVDEVAGQVMGEKANDQIGLRFFVVDCRGLRSSEDLKSGRIPAAYTLDPSIFDSPELLDKSMDAFNPLKSRVHVVLVGHGVGIPPELVNSEEVKTSIRDALRHDTDCINQASLFFQKRGFRFVSSLDGGYSSWHAFMRDSPACSPQELLNHVEEECVYCRYDTILRTGEDPFKQKKQTTKVKRKKAAMPTTTTLLVNGGEGDPSILSTNSGMPVSNGSTASSSGPPSFGRQLSLTRPSISSMRSKLSEVKIPKLQWRRRSSGASANNNHNDSGSSSETMEDGNSDHESPVTDDPSNNADEHDDEATQKILREALEHADDAVEGADGGKDKDFVGVFTIDYSDDEDDGQDNNAEEEASDSAVSNPKKAAEPEVAAAPATVVGAQDAAPTLTA